MKVRFAKAALKDLAEVGEYTRQVWGKEQARRYRDMLKNRIKWLGREENKTLWHGRPELGQELFSYIEGSHVIIFRTYERGIEIIRVLHSRMDLKRHL